MSQYIHAAAARLWERSVGAEERVLIIGATGWFGRTAVALTSGTAADRMLIASRAREFTVDGETVNATPWDWGGIEAFAPTLVVDCAFLTRDLVSGTSHDEYVRTNTGLTENLLRVAALGSVTRVMTISSGAAVYPVDALSVPIEENPYGRLKREAEISLAELGRDRDIATVVARAWSVSGAFVQKPRSYAFTDMIEQAEAGSIHISATRPVFRRYVGVEDLLAVSLGLADSARSLTLESGGPLVEMADLARIIADTVNPSAEITRDQMTSAEPNDYYAPAEPWDDACRSLGFAPAGLTEQVLVAQAGLRLTY